MEANAPRRRLVLCTAAAIAWPGLARAQDGDEVRLSVPGPGGTISDPLVLATRLGLDRAAGVSLRLRFVSGGGVSIKDLETGNAEFAVFGLPAAALARAQGLPLVTLAAIDDLPLYSLVVRQDLVDRVRTVADLRSRVLGVHSNSLAARTTSTQLAELLLRSAGVAPNEVRLVAAGQSWETQSSVLRSRTVDASMCDEPIGARLETAGLGHTLFSTGREEDAHGVPGAGFLRGALMAREDTVDRRPELAGRMVDLVRRTLTWIAGQSAGAMADALGLTGGERESYLDVRRRFRRIYSADGRFSTAQLEQTRIFLRAANPEVPAVQAFDMASLVRDRWAGRKA